MDIGRFGNYIVLGRVEVDLDRLGLFDDAAGIDVQLGHSQLGGSERLDHGDDRQPIWAVDDIDQGRAGYIFVQCPGPLDLSRDAVQPVDGVTSGQDDHIAFTVKDDFGTEIERLIKLLRRSACGRPE